MGQVRTQKRRAITAAATAATMASGKRSFADLSRGEVRIAVRNLKDGLSTIGRAHARSGRNSEVVISFRGSSQLKERLARKRDVVRKNGGSLNDWLAETIACALNLEERGHG
jgi:hypothetical protein